MIDVPPDISAAIEELAKQDDFAKTTMFRAFCETCFARGFQAAYELAKSEGMAAVESRGAGHALAMLDELRKVILMATKGANHMNAHAKQPDPATAAQIAKLEKQLERMAAHLEAQLGDLESAFDAKLREARQRVIEKSNAKAAPIRKMLEALKGG